MDWEKIDKLGAIEREKMATIERKLFTQPSCTISELMKELNLTSEKRVQDYIGKLRECYSGDNDITRAPYKLKYRDIAHLIFPEMLLTNNERQQLHNIFKLATIFDGAIPIRDILEASGCMDNEFNDILKNFSRNIEVTLDARLARLIANIYTAISEKKVVSFRWTQLSDKYAAHDDVLHVAPYYLKRYEGNWYLIGGVRNLPFEGWIDFPWTVFPLQRILKENPNDNPLWFCQKDNIKYKEVDVNRILRYYGNVIGCNVPTIEGEKFKEQLDVKEIVIKVNPFKMRRLREYPIHSTQKCNEGENTVTINVIENNELYSRLMSYGSDIEVVRPKEIREKLNEKLAKALKHYAI